MPCSHLFTNILKFLKMGLTSKSELYDNTIKYSIVESNSQILNQTLASHPFNSIVSVFLPHAMNIDENIKNIIIEDSDIYCIWDVPVYKLIEKPFIEAFVKRGELTLISRDVCIQTDDCLCITPDGYLALSLNYDTYYKIGIIQCPSVQVKKLTQDKRYFVLINLKNKSFAGKNYTDLYKKLKNVDFKLNFNAIWEPTEGVCSTSMPIYFQEMGLHVEQFSVHEKTELEFNLKIPKIDVESEDFFNWFASVQLGITNDEEITDLNPEDMTEIGQYYLISWIGLIPVKKILNLLQTLKTYLSEKPSVPFIALDIQGFIDTPISFNKIPHRCLLNRYNSITYIIQNDGKTRMCVNHTPFHP